MHTKATHAQHQLLGYFFFFLHKCAAAVSSSEFNRDTFPPARVMSIQPTQLTILWRRSQAEQIFQRNLREEGGKAVFKMELHTFPLPIFHTVKSLGNCLGKLMLPPGKFQVPKQLFFTDPPEV